MATETAARARLEPQRERSAFSTAAELGEPLSQLLPRGHTILFHGDFFGRAVRRAISVQVNVARKLC
eukprot:2067237-Prymnesium_polylepis.1